MANDTDLNALLFRGQDLLNTIYENKKFQKELTYQFIALAAGLFFLTRLNDPSISKLGKLFVSIALVASNLITIRFLFMTHFEILTLRKKLIRIWDDDYFTTVRKKQLLFENSEERKKYLNKWHGFTHYTMIYIAILGATTLLLIFLIDIDVLIKNILIAIIIIYYSCKLFTLHRSKI